MPTGRTILALILCLLASHPGAAQPQRVVSLNLCTDQLVMLLAAPGQITALSRVSRDPVTSALWREAAAHPIHHGSAEEIHLLAPGLIVAGEYSDKTRLAMLRRLGHRIEVFPVTPDFPQIRQNVTRMGALLGRETRARTLLAQMDKALDTLAPEGPKPRAAIYYSNGYSPGAGTLADAVLSRAGYTNIAAERGINGLARLPLESLLFETPDILITGQSYGHPALAHQILRHPALRSANIQPAELPANLWACGTPLSAQAVEHLRAIRP